ncbi:hypothetical protein [Deinococcus yavapaiensis]|uniref:Uncharacterized protein n=1 Tax=Deinococcus yavapaiensis KR-236 TaxID=694435 RepID=A0A318S9G6_9DEIO|nr:hypothetical protein [Deinococcus yavapaiensis]PYE55780.1 hypothetical protein DES52_102144 [Deinococcus yavapaiensis KR-236]
MRAFLLPLTLIVGLSSTALAREPYVPCDLAVKLDYATYLPIAAANLGGWSEASEDDAAGHYADCQAAALSASLQKSPNLRARLAKLRTLLRQLSSQESGLASMLAGGGTRYFHAIPRSYVDIEGFLKSLAALASDSYGGLNASGGSKRLGDLTASFDARLRTLRARKPSGTLKLVNASLADYRKAIDDYEKTYKAIRSLLGRKADIATLAAYEFVTNRSLLQDVMSE